MERARRTENVTQDAQDEISTINMYLCALFMNHRLAMRVSRSSLRNIETESLLGASHPG